MVECSRRAGPPIADIYFALMTMSCHKLFSKTYGPKVLIILKFSIYGYVHQFNLNFAVYLHWIYFHHFSCINRYSVIYFVHFCHGLVLNCFNHPLWFRSYDAECLSSFIGDAKGTGWNFTIEISSQLLAHMSLNLVIRKVLCKMLWSSSLSDNKCILVCLQCICLAMPLKKTLQDYFIHKMES